MAVAALSGQSYSLDTLLDETLYTFTRLYADPSVSKLATTFETLLNECKKARETEFELHQKIIAAQAKVDTCDDRLDAWVDELSSTILKLTQGDRKHVLYQRYFGSIRPSDLKKPVLGQELQTVRGWFDSLKTSSHKELQDLSATLETLVKECDSALSAAQQARNKMADFRTTGDRAVLFDKVNAARKLTYGELGKMSFDTVDKKSTDFANSFFLRTQTKKRPDPESASELQTEIEDTQNRLNDLQERYRVLCEREENEAKLLADYEAEMKRITDTEKALKESVQRAEDLKNKLGKK